MHLQILSSVLLMDMFDLRCKELKWRKELLLQWRSQNDADETMPR